MPNKTFCAVCQAMLATKATSGRQAPHHPDGTSFRQALEMCCRICLQIWASLHRPDILHPTTWSASINAGQIDCNEQLVITHLTPAGGSNTGSNQSFEFLIGKYRECTRNHAKCSKITAEPYLPSRLLDVGSSERDMICLVDQERVLPTASYATLSHCWGGSQPLKLTSSTQSALRVGILVNLLPRTFQHAVIVARRLEIRWLWIDSLCIIQDDIDDWSIQSSAMQRVYQHAVLNIAATAAQDGSFGLFQKRDPAAVMPFQIESTWHMQGKSPGFARPFICTRNFDLTDLIDNAPLNKRAWVMQERQLSRRIVHFSSEMLYWECHELFANEINPEGLLPEESDFRSWETTNFKRRLDTSHPINDMDPKRELLYKSWNDFLYQYTGCQITYPEDRFVALAGLAHLVSSLIDDELVAGVWRKQFPEGLCWYTDEYTDTGSSIATTRPWVAPSWSWASCCYASHRAHTIYVRKREDLLKIVDFNIRTKSSGALIDGFMQLHCKLIPAKLRFEQGPRRRLNWMVFQGSAIAYDQALKLFLDGPCFLEGTDVPNDIQLLLIYEGPGYFGVSTVVGIAVVPSATKKGAYQRIGCFFGEYEFGNYNEGNHANLNSWTTGVEFYAELVKRHRLAREQVIKLI
ncbi:hypothetical protein SVAN01_10968 [Stagonosporopsis vannaccii]|nr:hypothetical protein SVAN01_10968 [Stagonosporopsis vannaccii]